MSNNNEYLVIPRGRMYLAEQRDDGSFGPERFMGDCPEMTITPEVETADANDSGSATGRLMKTVTLRRNKSISVTCREVLARNLAMFLGGSLSTVTQAAGSVAGEALDSEAAEADAYYQLGMTDEDPTGARLVSNVILKTGATVYEQGRDYLVDAELGRVYIPAGSACVGAVVTADYDVAEATWPHVGTLDSSDSKTVRIRIISDNVGGRNRDWLIPLAIIQPDGALSFTSESDWQSVGFVIRVLTPEDAARNLLPDVLVDGRPLAVSGS